MRRILSNQKGVTLLEGLIAMGLLALVAAGTFGVLLSVSHKSGKPDIREEMALAVEKANDQLQAYAQNMTDTPANQNNLCPEDTQDHPLTLDNTHNIKCLLPVICAGSSSFSYTVTNPGALNFKNDAGGNEDYISDENYTSSTPSTHQRRITFSITCNGFTL